MILTFGPVSKEKTDNLAYVLQNVDYLKKKYPNHCTDDYISAATDELKKRNIDAKSVNTDGRRLITENGAKWYSIILFIHSGIWCIIVLSQIYAALVGDSSLFFLAAVNLGFTIWNIYIGVQYFSKKTLSLSSSLWFLIFGFIWYIVQIGLGSYFMIIPLVMLIAGFVIVMSNLQQTR